MRNEEALGASFLAYDLLIPVSEAPVPRNTEFSIGWEGSQGGLRVRLDAYTRFLDHIRLPNLEGTPITGAALGDPSLWEVSSGRHGGSKRPGAGCGNERFRCWEAIAGPSYHGRWGREHTYRASIGTMNSKSAHPIRLVHPPGLHGCRCGQGSRRHRCWPSCPSRDTGKGSLRSCHWVANTTPGDSRVTRGLMWAGGARARASWFGGGSLVPYISVANLFSLPNVVGWFVDRGRAGDEVEKVYLPQLPMIPFLGLEFRF